MFDLESFLSFCRYQSNIALFRRRFRSVYHQTLPLPPHPSGFRTIGRFSTKFAQPGEKLALRGGFHCARSAVFARRSVHCAALSFVWITASCGFRSAPINQCNYVKNSWRASMRPVPIIWQLVLVNSVILIHQFPCMPMHHLHVCAPSF